VNFGPTRTFIDMHKHVNKTFTFTVQSLEILRKISAHYDTNLSSALRLAILETARSLKINNSGGSDAESKRST
jgi:hypothetical protein